MVIAKTACRNVAFKSFKAANMGESAFADQSVILTRKAATAGSSSAKLNRNILFLLFTLY